jgi:2-pyrone-4,6-dicarboxylate lactonase
VSKGVDHPDFVRFINLMVENENIWTKVTCPERLTQAGAPYDDVVPYYQAIVDRFEDRVLWGTDWPHPNMKSHMPDDGALVDYIPRIARTEAQQQKLLVSNPMRLYWGV